jgi:tetratricopeptide (TPR) repeat protein
VNVRSPRTVRAAEPADFEALCRLGLRKFQQGEHGQAFDHFCAALKIRPDDPRALSNFGTVQAALEDVEGALATYRKALAIDPNLPETQFNCGNVLQRLGRPAEALPHYDAALAANPRYAEAHNNRGAVLRALRRPEEALESFASAVAANPRLANALYNHASLLKELGRGEEALAAYDKALAINPGFAEGHILHGELLRELGRLEQAGASYEKATKADPKNALARLLLGDMRDALNRPVEALALYDKALSLNPDFAEAHDRRGLVLKSLGRLGEARQAQEKAIALAPDKAAFYYNLAEATRLSRDDPHFRAMENLARDEASLQPQDQIVLRFALAKILADNGDHKGAAHHLLEGNALKRRQIDYDEKAVLADLENIAALFTREFMDGCEGVGDPSPLPVFILGMPRSGSTLVEQILSSHPKVCGAGEIPDFVKTLTEVCGVNLKNMQFDAPDRLREQLREIGADYICRIRRIAPNAERIVNKTPDNFRFVGLIRLALPNACIIHTRRDPLDTCLSCFSKLFTESILYSYELGELGRYYRAYDGLMAHWRSALPKAAMLELQYEQLVADFERQARSLIAHCGLEWDEACLAFHRSERPVRTASAVQVRQPIHAASIGAAANYDACLAPLKRALGPSILSQAKGVSTGADIFGSLKTLARGFWTTKTVRV